MTIKMQQVYHELDKATNKTCFCIHEYSAKIFGGWREGESILIEENECGTATGDHVKCDLFLYEVARQEKHVTAPKVARKHDIGSTVYRRGVKKKEGEEKSYFCHLENPIESIQQYRKSKGKLCTAIVDDYMKVVSGEPCEKGINKFQFIVDPLDQNEGAHSHHPVGTIVYKGSTSGVYYTEPSYPPLYDSPTTTLTNSFHREEALSGHSPRQQAMVANDDWVPGNAIYQERNSSEQLYNSVGYYYHHGGISLLKPVIKHKRSNSPVVVQEKIAVKHLRKRDGKRCAVIEYNKTDAEQLAIADTKESVGRLRSAKMKSSSVETDQNKLQDLVVTQSYTSISKLDTTPQSRQTSGSLRSKKSRTCLLEKRETISSIPSKSSSLSRLPELHVSSRGLTVTQESGTQEENGDSNQSSESGSKVRSNGTSLLLVRPPLPFVSKQQISDRLQKVSKQLTRRHTHLPRPFKPLTKAKHSPFYASPNKHAEKIQSNNRTKTSDNHYFEEARCVLRSRERRKGRLNRKVGGSFHQERTSYRVKVCLKGSKVPLINPPTKPTEDNEDTYYNVEELYAE